MKRRKTTPAKKTDRSLFTSSRKWKTGRARKRWPAGPNPLLRFDETFRDRTLLSPSAQPAAALRLAAMESFGSAGGAQPVSPVVGGNNWVQVGPMAIPNGQTYTAARVLVSGRVTGIAIHPTIPGTIYLATAQGGVWKSIDGGNNWEPKTDNEVSLAAGSIAIDPLDPDTVYVGTGEGNFSQDSYYGLGILKTTNGGDAWANLGSSPLAGRAFGRIVITPGTTSRLFGATTGGLYRSLDSGNTWAKLTSGLPAAPATDVAIDPTTPTTVYAAFWNNGIYKTANADAATPTWTQLTTGLPSAAAASPSGFTRISLAVSPSSPLTLFALMANNDTTSPLPGPPYRYAVDKLFVSTNGGLSWSSIALPAGPGDGIGGQGFYNLLVTVDPTTPDIIYLSGISLWKGVKSGAMWTFSDIGGAFHPDNHALAIDPTNHLILYAGSDGGVYKSTDGGLTWTDSINKGLCITQFEFIDQHPSSDAVVIGGTQDNGTEQFRAGEVFYHADEGDGGFGIIDQSDPMNMIATYFYPSPKRSTQGGTFGSWVDVSSGIGGTDTLFYPPMTACVTDPNRIALGTNIVNVDTAQGTGGWATKVTLPGLAAGEKISALSFVNPNLLYAATTMGNVYKVTGPVWSATRISQAPLPAAYIWDVSPLPADPDTVVLVMSNFGLSHVWKGAVPATGIATWTNISGTGAGVLPDIPVNALVIDPADATGNTMYIATDIAVFRTSNGGTTWTPFSDGLPNCAVFDLRLQESSRLLRAATHGRGLWEKPLDVPSTPPIDIYVRDHVMETGRESPSPSDVVSVIQDPLRHVAMGDHLWWWMCADIKIDALEPGIGGIPSYQMPITDVDYVAFEAKLQHRNPQRGRINRVYVQVHNRGFHSAGNVNVKVLWADASAGLPALPADFWTAFPGTFTDTTQWHPIGTAQSIVSLAPGKPWILEWDWTTPVSSAEHSCILVVVDSASDPIPAGHKVFDVGILVANEKRVGLKNLHVVDASPGTAPSAILNLSPVGRKAQTIRVRPRGRLSPRVTLAFPKGTLKADARLEGFAQKALGQSAVRGLMRKYGDALHEFDLTKAVVQSEAGKVGSVALGVIPAGGIRSLVVFDALRANVAQEAVTVIQEEGGAVIGGTTYIVRRARS
jgi:photosystem II stability/assembly factor-like uncharacterized protein